MANLGLSIRVSDFASVCLPQKNSMASLYELQVLSKTLDSTALTPEKVELATLVHDPETDAVSIATWLLIHLHFLIP